MQATEHYCREKAAPPGSDLYYSLLDAASAHRRAVIAIHALRIELNALSGSGNAAIALTKLDWWRDELHTHLPAGRPRHPATQLLATVGAGQLHTQLAQWLQDLLDAAAMDIDVNAYRSFDQLLVYSHRAGSSVALLCSTLAARAAGTVSGNAPAAEFAHELGVGLLLLRLLGETRQHARAGRCYIPDDDLRRFAVSPDELLVARTPPSVQQLFRHQAQRIRDFCLRADECLAPAQRYPQRDQLVLARLGLALLDELERDGFRLLEHRISLTPLRKLWLAWRLLRKENKNHRSFNRRPSPTAA